MKPAKPQEPTAVLGGFPVEYTYTAGIGLEKFLRELKDNERIVGSKCHVCGLTYVPTRMFCERCFSELSDTVNVSLVGEIVSYTIIYFGKDWKPLPAPVTVALIRFPNTTGGIVHLIKGLTEVRVGAKVKPQFLPLEQRRGSLLDIRCFVPA